MSANNRNVIKNIVDLYQLFVIPVEMNNNRYLIIALDKIIYAKKILYQ